eukprot:TRINITY_DN4750_c0_g1_i11.p2 TRINITY_DN4750_c0_g1~~TRINITY_DN4750_c0_g1_i11.p2  ORF type:complete len:292 (-),score=28.17 TRINITY_DN4750_c0_g1_i11:553-1428(-)
MNNLTFFSLFFSLLTVVLSRLIVDDSAAEKKVVPLMHWGDFAYFVSSTPATYHDAVASCEVVGATLVKIESPYESFTLARRFIGSDHGDKTMNAFTAIDWSASDVASKIAFWVGNSPKMLEQAQTASALDEAFTPNMMGGLSASGNPCVYVESTKQSKDGIWQNDESCDTRMHFVCKKPLVEMGNQVQKSTVFASLTLDCIVSPRELVVTHAFKNAKEELLVVIPYPQTCSMKGVESSTAVVAVDIEAAPMAIRYYIVDATRKLQTHFEGGIMTYVGNIEEVLDQSSSQIL